jgi:hypothetical protein
VLPQSNPQQSLVGLPIALLKVNGVTDH